MMASADDDVRLTTYADFVKEYFGITITDAKKSPTLRDHHGLDEGEIMKRRPYYNGIYWVGLLDPSAIVGQLQWLSLNAGTPEHATMANMNSALREFGLYGERTFKFYRTQFVKHALRQGWKVDLITYPDFVETYISRV
jgi:hypothetical protein